MTYLCLTCLGETSACSGKTDAVLQSWERFILFFLALHPQNAPFTKTAGAWYALVDDVPCHSHL